MTGLILAAVLNWGIDAETEWTEFRRYLVPGRTLDSAFTARINASACEPGRVWRNGRYKIIKRCVTVVIDDGENYLYERRECKVTGCEPWKERERMWCVPMAGVSGAKGCPCFFASEGVCVDG